MRKLLVSLALSALTLVTLPAASLGAAAITSFKAKAVPIPKPGKDDGVARIRVRLELIRRVAHPTPPHDPGAGSAAHARQPSSRGK